MGEMPLRAKEKLADPRKSSENRPGHGEIDDDREKVLNHGCERYLQRLTSGVD